MLKKIYEFIDDYASSNDIFQIVTFLICGILGFALIFFYVVDSTPAAEEDYAPLIEQNSVIQKDFSKVYTYDNYEISPSKNNIKVTFSNDQCKLACTYDKNFKFIKDKKIDLAESKFGAIFISFIGGFIFLGVIGMYVLAMFLPFVLYRLLKFLEWICLLLVGRR